MAKVKKLTADEKFHESISRWQPTEKPTFTPTQRNDTQSIVNKWKPTTPIPVVKKLVPDLPITTKPITPINKNKKVVQQGKVAMKGLVRPDNPAAPLFVNALNTATFGSLERNSKVIDQLKEKSPISSTIGSMLGYIAPGAAVKKLVKPVISKIAKPLAKRVIEGALIGGGIEGVSGTGAIITGDKTKKEVAKNVALGVAFGGVADGLIHGIGQGVKALKTIPKVKQNIFNNKFGELPNINTDKVLNPKGLKATNTVKGLIPKKETPKVQFTQGKFNNMQSKLKGLFNPNETVLKPSTNNLKVESVNIPKANKVLPSDPLQAKNIPISTQQTGKSRFIDNSVQNSEIAPKAMKETVVTPPYIKVNNKDTWAKALAEVEENHQSSLNKYFSSNELKSADDTALGQALITKAIREGRIENANEISVDLAEKLSRAGQTVQAASIFKRLSPEGMLQYANNSVTRINQVIAKETGLSNSIKKVILSDDEANKILQGMKEYGKMTDGADKDIKIAQIMQIINNKQPSSIVDKVRAARNISLLGNIGTNARNVIGNGIMGVTDNVANTIGSPLDYLISKKTGNRTVGLPNLGIQAKGMMTGTKEALEDSFGGVTLKSLKGKSLKEIKTTLTEGFNNPINRDLTGNGKFEMGNRLAFDNKPMRAAENVVGTALKVGDTSFKTAYRDDVLNQLMKTNKVTEATDEMRSIAQQIAEERTYQDNNNLTKFAMAIKNAPQKLQGKFAKEATQIFMDSQLPYVRTPANLLKRAIEYTPVGLGDGVSKLSSMLKTGAKNGSYSMTEQRAAVDRITRGIVGTGLMGGGAYGVKNKILTGAASDDKDIRALEQQVGKQPYAVNLKDGKQFNYNWAQPISMPVSAGGQMVQGGKGLVNNSLDAVSNALTFYSEQPMLQSIQNFVGSKYDGKTVGQRLVEAGLQLPKQFVPTLLKQVNKTKDDTVRNTYSPDFIENTLANPMKAGIPNQSNKLPIKYDTLGREIKQYQGNNTFANVGINPGKLTKDVSISIEKEVFRLYNESGQTIQTPTVVEKKILKSKDNPQVDLTGAQQSEYQRLTGTKTATAFNKIIGSYFYNQLKTDEEKAKMLADAIKDSKAEAKLEILKSMNKYNGNK